MGVISPQPVGNSLSDLVARVDRLDAPPYGATVTEWETVVNLFHPSVTVRVIV
jgi:hypothetical protein